MEPNEKQPEEHPRDRLRRAAEALFGALWKRKTARFLGVGWREFRGWGKGDGEPPSWAVEVVEYERLRRREAVKGAEMSEPTKRGNYAAWSEYDLMLEAARRGLFHGVNERSFPDAGERCARFAEILRENDRFNPELEAEG